LNLLNMFAAGPRISITLVNKRKSENAVVMESERDARVERRDKRPSPVPVRCWEIIMKKFLAAAAFVAAATIAAPAFAALEKGAVAPDFSAKGMLGGNEFTFKLADELKKGPVVMYFFPAAYTKGCTIETAAFAEKAEEFKAAGATLVGLTAGAAMADGKMVSASENLARLGEFSKEHCRDKFPIAAVSSDTVKAYNVVLGQKPDWSDRTSYVIAPDGKILLSHTDMQPMSHIEKTLETVKAYKAAHAAHANH
jgi:peroxiredoxin